MGALNHEKHEIPEGATHQKPRRHAFRKYRHKEAQNFRRCGSTLLRTCRRHGGSCVAPVPLCLFVATPAARLIRIRVFRVFRGDTPAPASAATNALTVRM